MLGSVPFFEFLAGFISISVALVFTATLVFARRWQTNRKYKLPPGPFSIPLVGHLNFILSLKPHIVLDNMRKKYGNIFGLYIGVRYVVVTNTFKMVKETYNKRPFLDRPPTYFRVTTDVKNFAEMNGDDWVTHRQLVVNGLKFLGVGRNRFEEICLDELSRVIPKMEAMCGKGQFYIGDVITGSINNTIFQLTCSRWFEDDHPTMKVLMRFQDLIAESFANNTSAVYFPFLDWLVRRVSPHQKDIWRSSSEIREFVRSEVISHQSHHDENNNHDYIDLFLTEIKARKDDPDPTFDTEHLVTDCMFLLMAGSDTVRNSLEWFFMTMAHFSESQEKVYNEIVSVLGRDRLPLHSDKGTLPYTECVILEIQRWKTLVPLNCLRWVTEDTTLEGYQIPKGTVIINNLWASHKDPSYWEDPEEFRPERFMSKDGTRSVMPEYFFPFSIGKRDCPGDKMAQIELFLYFVAIMQRFKFLPPKGGVCFDDFARVNLQPSKPIVKVARR